MQILFRGVIEMQRAFIHRPTHSGDAEIWVRSAAVSGLRVIMLFMQYVLDE